jgi:hypothetical protein
MGVCGARVCQVWCLLRIVGEWREDGSRSRANAHLSEDETVAKMGHPILLWVRPGHPPCEPNIYGRTPQWQYEQFTSHPSQKDAKDGAPKLLWWIEVVRWGTRQEEFGVWGVWRRVGDSL